eukprot:TRINITY_DN620_c0_g1_i1.p1 TRINITY_DN620_c0_g1~~TRINITY_DN620_c0_g1_i1.p1  ORF type:complete len:502 (+),score=61.89 TRINITY_DN620_c0_g1_i1:239-1744(+)
MGAKQSKSTKAGHPKAARAAKRYGFCVASECPPVNDEEVPRGSFVQVAPGGVTLPVQQTPFLSTISQSVSWPLAPDKQRCLHEGRRRDLDSAHHVLSTKRGTPPPKPQPEAKHSTEILPDFPYPDLALLCLAHVPLSTFPILRAVCKQWKGLVDTGLLLRIRQEHAVAESWLCALEWGSLGSRDMVAHLWGFEVAASKWHDLSRLHFMDGASTGCRVVAIGTILLFLGGVLPVDTYDRFLPSGEVWQYDLVMRKITRASSMLVARDRFASAVIGGKLYVAGGLGSGYVYAHDSLRSAEVYDPKKDVWERLPDIPTDASRMPALECQGAAVNGKFIVRGSWSKTLADIFDPVTRTWQTEPAWFPPDTSPPFYTRLQSAGNRLYLLNTVPSPTPTRRHELRIYNAEEEKWEGPVELPGSGFVGAVSITAVGNKVYLAGGEDPRACLDEFWASYLPFHSRTGKKLSEPCVLVYDVERKGAWEAINPPQFGVVTRWLGSCTVVTA